LRLPSCGHILLAALPLRNTVEAVMPHSPSSPRRRLAVLAAAFGLAVLIAPAAHAFTIDNEANTTSNGTARYSDPDSRFSNSANGPTVYKQGNATLQFGTPQSFDQRYNANRLFNPNPGPGDDR
jgi:hypothetical protein